jgi:hypothetical protein
MSVRNFRTKPTNKKPLTLALPKALWLQVRNEAARQRRPMSDLLTDALIVYFAQLAPPPPSDGPPCNSCNDLESSTREIGQSAA